MPNFFGGSSYHPSYMTDRPLDPDEVCIGETYYKIEVENGNMTVYEETFGGKRFRVWDIPEKVRLRMAELKKDLDKKAGAAKH